MKGLIVVGLLLVVLGIAGFAMGGVSWTETETVAEFGELKITNDDEKSFVIPPLASGAALAAGLVLVVVGALRK